MPQKVEIPSISAPINCPLSDSALGSPTTAHKKQLLLTNQQYNSLCCQMSEFLFTLLLLNVKQLQIANNTFFFFFFLVVISWHLSFLSNGCSILFLKNKINLCTNNDLLNKTYTSSTCFCNSMPCLYSGWQKTDTLQQLIISVSSEIKPTVRQIMGAQQ